MTAPKTSTISVIIPTFNEAANLAATLRSLREVAGMEIIVVDGGSRDGTVALAKAARVRVVVARPGRARPCGPRA